MLDSHAYGADIVRFDGIETEDEKRIKERKKNSPYNFDGKLFEMEQRAKESEMMREAKLEEARYKVQYDEYSDVDEYYSEIE